MRHVGPISGISCSSAKYIATAGYDNQLILWDSETGQGLSRGLHDHLVNQCDFAPGGDLIASASSDHSARIWSVPDLQLRSVLNGHSDDVMKVAFSPDGERVATCSLDGTLGIFDVEGRMHRRFVGHTGMIESFDWSRDGRQVHSCGTDGTVRTWDVASGACVAVREFDGVDLDVLVTLSSGAYFAGENDGHIIRVADGADAKRFAAHQAGVKRLIVNADESRLLSMSYDGSVTVWEILPDEDLALLRTSRLPDCVWPRSAAFLDDRRVAYGTFASKYALWDYIDDRWSTDDVAPVCGLNAVEAFDGDIYAIGDSGILLKNGAPMGGPSTLCNFIVPLPDLIVTGGQKGVVYDAVSGAALYAHFAPLNCGVVFGPPSRRQVAIGSYSGHILVFDYADGTLVKRAVVAAHQNAIKGMATDGRRLFSGCADGELSIYDLESWSRLELVTKAHDSILNDTCACADGFATVSRDLTLRIWSGTSSYVARSHHQASIKSVAADRAGQVVATGSYRGTIELFDLGKREWIAPVLRPTAAGISSLCWDEAGGRFLASSYDGAVFAIARAAGGDYGVERLFSLTT